MTLIEQWAAYQAAVGHSSNTTGIRLRTLRALMNHAGVSDPLSLTRIQVIAFLGRSIKPWSRVTYWRCLNAWSKWVVEFDHLPTCEILRGIPCPKPPEAAARNIDDETIRRLLAHKMSPRAKTYVTLALYQLMRVHEIAKIRGEDFDLAAGWLTVHGKGGVTKPIPVHPKVGQLALSMPEFGYWFPTPEWAAVQHVAAVAVSATIGGALRDVGSSATAHQLRDTGATMMQRKGKDIRVTQTMTRHRTLMSVQKYTGVADDAMKDAVLLLDWTAAA